MFLIGRREGFGVPKSIPTRLNNPGDLLFRSQPSAIAHPVTGMDGEVRNYASFATLEQGQASFAKQIQLNSVRGQTMAQFIGHWAPPGNGNDTSEYLRYNPTSCGGTM